MKYLTNAFLLTLVASAISCGRNEPQETETNYTETSNITTNNTVANYPTTETQIKTENTKAEETDTNSDSGLGAAIQRQIPNSETSKKESAQNTNPIPSIVHLTAAPIEKKEEVIIDTPLRNLLRNAHTGKSYSKKELIDQYKFPKEAVDLIKKVTCVGPNKLYFNWGSTWLVEKVSDAKFENDTMVFTFKKNKTYVSGGAIGIKYNKKIYTDLMLNNGSAYIPTVKGYHWEINK